MPGRTGSRASSASSTDLLLRHPLALGVIAGLLCAPLSASGGAWTVPQGGYYLKVAANSLATSDVLDSGGTRRRKPGMGRLSDLTVLAYLEYGWRDRLTVVASAPFRKLRERRRFATGVGTETSDGFGDLEFRLRWGLDSHPVVVAATTGVSVPLGYDIDPNTRVPLGTGKFAADVRLLVGRSLYPRSGYATTEVGYRARAGRFSDEVFWGLEVGFGIGRLLIRGAVTGLHTRGRCGATTVAGLVGDQEIFKIAPGMIYRIGERVEVNADLIHIADGCNTAAGNTLSIGLAVRS